MTINEILNQLQYDSKEELIKAIDKIPTRAEKLMFINELVYDNNSFEEHKKDDIFEIIYGEILNR